MIPNKLTSYNKIILIEHGIYNTNLIITNMLIITMLHHAIRIKQFCMQKGVIYIWKFIISHTPLNDIDTCSN